MWKKHYKTVIACVVSAVLVVLALILLVVLFEKYNIHVPGSREMWMGVIGAIIGGMYTLVGVLLTIYKQQDAEEEKNRIEYMPILGFEVTQDVGEIESTLSCDIDKLLTSAFTFKEEKQCCGIMIFLTNSNTVFDFTIEGCTINGIVKLCGDFFNPATRRIAVNEKVGLVFNYDNPDETMLNHFCVIRFSYKDVFGNKYYQDLPFIYGETTGELICQHIDIRDIKPPILADKQAMKISEVSKHYSDYSYFYNRK